MSLADKEYNRLAKSILLSGDKKEDRTGTGTHSLFGKQMRFDLSKEFPLLTGKKVFTKGIIKELKWMLNGETNAFILKDQGVNIWNEWADENGELGPVYGFQWRSWPTSNGESIDQITNVVNQIKTNPNSRRLIVSAWNVADVDKMKLPPCHLLFQFYVSSDRKLSCQLYQRSADMFLGVPFNIASYSLLTHIIAAECGLDVGEFVWTGGDCHIYLNHVEQMKEQLSRPLVDGPSLEVLIKKDNVWDYDVEDFVFNGYNPNPAIKADVSV